MPNYECQSCRKQLRRLERTRGFATIPAQRERWRCDGCGLELALYLWWPPINGRSHCAFIVNVGRAAI